MRNLAIAVAASGIISLGIGGCAVLGTPSQEQPATGGHGGAFSGLGGGLNQGGEPPTQVDVQPAGQTGPTSDQATTGAGGSPQNGTCKYGDSSTQQIVAAPDPTRAVDSAVYARAALLQSLAPDPSVLRLNDFLNLYGSARNVSAAESQSEIEYLYDEGVIEARFPMPNPPAHTQRSFVVLVDTSLSMQPGFDLEKSVVTAVAGKLDGAQGDELRVVAWSDVLQTLYQGSPTTDLDSVLAPAFASPGGSSDLGQALTKTLAFATESATTEKHVLVLTDGGATTNGAVPALATYAAQGVRLDVVLIAPQSRLSDPKTPGRAAVYNQALLTALTEADGARLVVTDVPDTEGKLDVDTLLTDRFEEFFGTALPNPRAIFTIPSMLQFVASGLVAHDASELVSRGVGYDRMLTFRVRVDDQSHLAPTELPTACAEEQITAALDGFPQPVSTPILSQQPTRLGHTRRAITDFVAALRDPTPTSFSTAQQSIAAAKTACCSLANIDSLCSVNTELQILLSKYPTTP